MPISLPHRLLFAAFGALLQTAAAAAQNAPPVAAEGHRATQIETAVESVLPASDPDGDALTFSVTTPPRKGTLVVVQDTGTFVYTPNKLESGADLLTFQASDGQATSAVTPFAVSIAEPGDNVALHRTVEVTVPGQLASAPELVDGDLTTTWTSHPGMSGDLGLVIDLGESRRVWRVVIHCAFWSWVSGRSVLDRAAATFRRTRQSCANGEAPRLVLGRCLRLGL